MWRVAAPAPSCQLVLVARRLLHHAEREADRGQGQHHPHRGPPPVRPRVLADRPADALAERGDDRVVERRVRPASSGRGRGYPVAPVAAARPRTQPRRRRWRRRGRGSAEPPASPVGSAARRRPAGGGLGRRRRPASVGSRRRLGVGVGSVVGSVGRRLGRLVVGSVRLVGRLSWSAGVLVGGGSAAACTARGRPRAPRRRRRPAAGTPRPSQALHDRAASPRSRSRPGSRAEERRQAAVELARCPCRGRTSPRSPAAGCSRRTTPRTTCVLVVGGGAGLAGGRAAERRARRWPVPFCDDLLQGVGRRRRRCPRRARRLVDCL